MFALRLADLAGATKPDAQRILLEAAIARLTEAADRFTSACPFEPGQFVTPRADGPYDNTGQPHLVIEVSPGDGRQSCGHNCWSHGETFDLRLIHIDSDGDILPMRGPHWAFEPYVAASVAEPEQPIDQIREDIVTELAFQDAVKRADPIEIAVLAVEKAIEAGFGLRNIVATVQARRDGQVPTDLNIRDAYVERACLMGNGRGDRDADGSVLAALLGRAARELEAFMGAADWEPLRESIDRALADHARAIEAGAAS